MKRRLILPLILIVVMLFLPVVVRADDTDAVTVSEYQPTDGLSAALSQKTDFSNAKYVLRKEGTSGAALEISGIQPIENHSYYLIIMPNNNTDEPDTSSNSRLVLSRVSGTNNLVTTSLDKYVELNQDLYAYIYETAQGTEQEYVAKGIKLQRYNEPKFNDAFFATHLTSKDDQVVTKFTHNPDATRKFTIKLGKITDINLLRKIKNSDASGLQELMSYAKSASAIASESFTLTKKSFLQYTTSDGAKLISTDSIGDKEYYFLYVVADTEGGKYITQEAVTLAISSKYSDGSWFMFFYGADDFKWTDLGNGTTNDNKDNSTANKTIPAAGEGVTIIVAISFLAGFSIALYRINKRYEGI